MDENLSHMSLKDWRAIVSMEGLIITGERVKTNVGGRGADSNNRTLTTSRADILTARRERAAVRTHIPYSLELAERWKRAVDGVSREELTTAGQPFSGNDTQGLPIMHSMKTW